MDHPAGPNHNNSCPQQLPSTSSAASATSAAPGPNLSPKRMRLTAATATSATSAFASAADRSPAPPPTLPRCCQLQRPSSTATAWQQPPPHNRHPAAVAINRYSEACDDHILEWQVNQISRSIIENTVNRVVESYNSGLEELYAEIEEQERQQERAAQVSYPAEYGRGEAEAIRVAIAGRGLHPPHEMLRSLSQLCSAPPGIGSLSSDDDDDDDDEELAEEAEEYGDDGLCELEGRLGGEGGGGGGGAAAANGKVDSNDAEHFQFMEAAVAVAIQKKGLAPSSSPSSSPTSAAEAASSGQSQENGGGDGAAVDSAEFTSQPG